MLSIIKKPVVALLNKLLSIPDLNYNYNHSNEIFQMIQKACIFVDSSKLKGDYIEFGVGKSFLMAFKLIRGKRMMWGFDSFQGLPEPKGIDDTGKFHKGEYLVTQKDIETGLKKIGRYYWITKLVKGFYDSLKDEHPHFSSLVKAAIVHIDCDLYDSTKSALDFIKHSFQTGTVLFFDDYYCFKGDPDKGGARALREFLEENKDITVTPWLTYHITGKSFIVKVKEETR